jgi:sugar phosphate isomerase/epimerase
MKGLDTSIKESILALSHRLQALHIHDNDKWQDSHQIPFSMDIDFKEMVDALKQINYSGYLTLEAATYLSAFDKDNAFKGVQDLANAARKIANMFEE